MGWDGILTGWRPTPTDELPRPRYRRSLPSAYVVLECGGNVTRHIQIKYQISKKARQPTIQYNTILLPRQYCSLTIALPPLTPPLPPTQSTYLPSVYPTFHIPRLAVDQLTRRLETPPTVPSCGHAMQFPLFPLHPAQRNKTKNTPAETLRRAPRHCVVYDAIMRQYCIHSLSLSVSSRLACGLWAGLVGWLALRSLAPRISYIVPGSRLRYRAG